MPLHRVSIAALLLLALVSAPAQQQRERLSVRLGVTPQGKDGSGEVVVRIWNAGAEDLNMPPMRFACSADAEIPHGSCMGARIQLSVFAESGTLRKANIPLAADTCTAREDDTGAAWRHLLPGQYAELRTTVKAGVLTVPGTKYTVRAAYIAPKLSGDEKSVVRYAGILIPRGQYSSNAVSYEVAADGASLTTRP